MLGSVVAEDRHQLHHRDVVFPTEPDRRASGASRAGVGVAELLQREIPRAEVRFGRKRVAAHGDALQRQPFRRIFGGHLEYDDRLGRIGSYVGLECLQGVELTRDRILHGILIAVAQLLDPAIRLQKRGIDRGGPRSVGIDFTPDVVALFLKPNNHLVCKPPAGVVEMQNDRRGTQRHGIGDEFLRTVVLGRVGAKRIACMCASRAAIACANFLHLEHLAGRDALSHIAHGAADARRARLQTLVNLFKNRVALFQGRARRAPARFLPGFQSGNGTVYQVIAL